MRHSNHSRGNRQNIPSHNDGPRQRRSGEQGPWDADASRGANEWGYDPRDRGEQEQFEPRTGSSGRNFGDAYGSNEGGFREGSGNNQRSSSDYGSNERGFGGGYGNNERSFGGGSGSNERGFGGGYGSDERGFGGGYRSNERGFGGGYGSNERGFGGGYGSNERGFAGNYGSHEQDFGAGHSRGRGPGQGMSNQGPYDARGDGRGPKNYRRSDERIREEVCDRLMQGGLNAEEVEVQVKEGQVTLTGTVDHRQDKRAIEDLAEAILGVKEVQNQLRVQKASAGSRSEKYSSSTNASGEGSSQKTSKA